MLRLHRSVLFVTLIGLALAAPAAHGQLAVITAKSTNALLDEIKVA